MQSSTPLLLAVASALWALYGSLLGALGAAAKWSFTGKLEPHAGFSMYDSLSFRRALVLISEIPQGEHPPLSLLVILKCSLPKMLPFDNCF